MKRFKLIEHTADTGLVAYGNSLAEAFSNAGYGLFSIITNINRVRQVESQLIEVSAEDAESLLFEWLNNLIYLFDVQYFLCKRFEITKFTEYNLKATCWGEKYDPSRHQLKREVKSATYHMLKTDRQQKKVEVIFDI